MSELLRHNNFPPGYWYYIKLPLGTTADALSEWFQERQLDIPPSHISVKEQLNHCSVIVCLPKSTALDLFTWAIDAKTFLGYQVNPAHLAAKNSQS
jgi:hypothetical protein